MSKNKFSSDKDALYLGIDGGGSKCKVIITDQNNKVLASAKSGSANPYQNYDKTIQSILCAAESALKQINLLPKYKKTQLDNLIAGAGLAGVNIPSIYQKMVSWQHPFAGFYLTSDLTTACLGAHQGEAGGVIVTGTGSCGFVHYQQYSAMLGGYGFPCGDQGSGAWFGLQCVEKVLLALDGVGEETLLVELLFTHLNINNALALVEQVQNQSSTFYAEFAHLVLKAAEKNDPVALAIIESGIHYLSKLAVQLQAEVQQLMAPNESLNIALLGGLAQSLLPYFNDDVRQLFVSAKASPEIGAVLFAKQQLALEQE